MKELYKRFLNAYTYDDMLAVIKEAISQDGATYVLTSVDFLKDMYYFGVRKGDDGWCIHMHGDFYERLKEDLYD